MKTLKNSKGFTLIEIIAVLVILGILAAVAVPKYVDMADQAKKSAAIGQVAEIKSALNLGYSKLYLSNGAAPATAAAVITAAGLTSGDNTMGTSPDIWVVTVTGASNKATIAVKSRDGDLKYNGTGSWYIPTS